MNFTGSLPTIAALRTRRSSEIVITETKFRRTLTRLTGSGAGLRPLPALRQRFAPDGCSHATRGVAYALTQPSVRRQSARSTRSGRFTPFWLFWALRQTGPALSFDAFAPAGWMQSHLIAYPKLTHAPVRHVVWTVSNLYPAAEANLSMIVHVFGGMAPQHSFVAV